jgi:hypothetical protein
MSDAPSLVAPRKALRSCPTSLARLSTLSRRCVQTARDSLCRSHPFSDVPCRSSSTPRALPRTRAASPHASENGISRSLDSPRSVLARPCLRGRRSRLETSSVVYPSHALLVRGACYVLARPGVRSQPPHPLHSHVRSRSRQRARALPSELARPDLTETPEGARRASETKGTSYRRLQPTFFRCQRRAALMRLVSLPVSLLRAFARFTPRWSAPFHGEHTPLRRAFCTCGRALSSRSAPRKPYL